MPRRRRPRHPTAHRTGLPAAGGGPASRPAAPPRRATVRRPTRPGAGAAAPRTGAGASPAGGPQRRSARRRTGLTTRAAILAVAVCAVVLSVAYPLRAFVSQRGEISAMQQHQRGQQQRVAALQRQRDRLADPAYIRSQARQRLHFVAPGETTLLLLGPPTAAGRPAQHPDAGVAATPGPWYARLWATAQVAAQPAAAHRSSR